MSSIKELNYELLTVFILSSPILWSKSSCALEDHSSYHSKYTHAGHNLSRLWALVLLINRPEAPVGPLSSLSSVCIILSF